MLFALFTTAVSKVSEAGNSYYDTNFERARTGRQLSVEILIYEEQPTLSRKLSSIFGEGTATAYTV